MNAVLDLLYFKNIIENNWIEGSPKVALRLEIKTGTEYMKRRPEQYQFQDRSGAELNL